jgi:cathepsin A (carboxypeptidase C)
MSLFRVFFEKFPQFKSNDFYVTGKSYGGIYVPTLSVNILRGKADINFKGFAVENGFLDAKRLGNSIIYFGYFHGLYGKTLWSKLVKNCCSGETNVEKCNFVNNSNSSCVGAAAISRSNSNLTFGEMSSTILPTITTSLYFQDPIKSK